MRAFMLGILFMVGTAGGAVPRAAEPLPNALAANGVREIVFALRKFNTEDGHWYANIGYYAPDANRKAYRSFGQLCKLEVATGKVTRLVDDPEGGVRDPVIDYDAQKVLFSYRRGGTEFYHLYEINLDGTGLKELTRGPRDDIEPCYLPDGGIVFVSTRCNRWVNCWLTQVATIHRCNGDGSNIRALSANLEQDNTPWVLPNGQLLYQRWEYVDRSQVHYHHLWTMNPDGTGQMVYYGNQRPGGVYIDAKPVPGSTDVLMINSPGHGGMEHQGRVALVTGRYGPDDPKALRDVTRSGGYRDPFPLDKNHYLVAKGTRILCQDLAEKGVELYQVPEELARQGVMVNEPRPVIKRQREPVMASQVNLTLVTGKLLLLNVYEGRNMTGIPPGSIKSLLVMEILPKPINYTGGMDPLTYGGSFTLERILGTVPVEADGSAYFEAPANRSLFLIALDAQGNSVKRMQSFLTVMPGESASCAGCHEFRTGSPPRAVRKQAFLRLPSQIAPVSGIPDLFDFPRDIQPILDRHCVRCHNPGKREGGVLLTGDHGPFYSHSYVTLTVWKQFVDGRNQPKSNNPPYSLGATPSPLMKKLDGAHHGVKLSPLEKKNIQYWIESAAVYPGTYAALGTGCIGGYIQNKQASQVDGTWPESQKAAEAINRRCASCHQGAIRLPRKLSDEQGVSFWRPDWNDHALSWSRHLVFNLTHPEQSTILLGPLAKSAGGYGACRKLLPGGKRGEPVEVFKDTRDPDYQAILAMVRAGQRKLDEIKRFDMPGFQPRPEYLREMKRFGVLPESFDPAREKVDPYQLDRRYWDSLHPVPVSADSAAVTAVPAAVAPTAPTARPPFVFACEEAAAILEFDAAGKLAWEYPAPMAREVWRLPNGNTLFTYNEQYGVLSDRKNPCGVKEVTRDKKVVFDYRSEGQLFSCQRLADGNTLVALAGQGKIQVVTPAGRVVREFAVKNKPGHGCMRNARQLENGNVLVAEESSRAAREYAADGRLLREFAVPFPAYSALRTATGDTLVCGQQGLVRFDRDGQKVWTLQGRDIPEMGVRWFAGIQLLPDGSIFVSNAGGKVPFFIVNQARQITWHSEPDSKKYPKGHGIQLLNQPWPPLK